MDQNRTELIKEIRRVNLVWKLGWSWIRVWKLGWSWVLKVQQMYTWFGYTIPGN